MMTDNYLTEIKYLKRGKYLYRCICSKEDLDKESGLHHLAHLKANVAMLIYYVENKVGKDDR